MKCPCCGAAALTQDTRDIPYTYKGETTNIPEVTGEFCPACGEVVLDRAHGDRYSEMVGMFQRLICLQRSESADSHAPSRIGTPRPRE